VRDEPGQQGVHQAGRVGVADGVTGCQERVPESDLVTGAGRHDRSGLRIGGRVYPAEGLFGRQVSGDYLGSALRAAALRR